MTDRAPRLTPRQRYLENRQRKQNLTFSVTASVMAVLVIISALVVIGIIKVPFGNDFSASTKTAAIGGVPCPSASTRPPDPTTVTVQVLNAGNESGQAKNVTDMLTGVGYQALAPSNTTTSVATSVEIQAGPKAVDAAYSVARFFPEARIILANSAGTTVTVTIGTYYDGVLSAEDTQKAAEDDSILTGQDNCLPVDPNILEEQSGTPSETQSSTEATDESTTDGSGS